MLIEIQDDFDMGKIASSGQCFRARKLEEVLFRFVTGEHVLYIRETGGRVFSVSCNEAEWREIWTGYFDLGRSYKDVYDRAYQKHEFVQKAMDYGRGLRILRQNPWEMLITFIISQRKSIPAITKTVEALSTKFGHQIETDYEVFASFPTPEEMQCASAEELKECGLGYRTPYILDAIARVTSGMLDLDAIAGNSDEELLCKLQEVYGVGKKVANCICLFAYGRMACVPVDVWIARAICEECGGVSPFPLFEADAGIIQQYVFYYEKSLNLR